MTATTHIYDPARHCGPQLDAWLDDGAEDWFQGRCSCGGWVVFVAIARGSPAFRVTVAHDGDAREGAFEPPRYTFGQTQLFQLRVFPDRVPDPVPGWLAWVHEHEGREAGGS